MFISKSGAYNIEVIKMTWFLRPDVIEKRKTILEQAGVRQTLGNILINHIANRRLENNKNTIFFLAGKNGEGKTWTSLSFAEAIQAPHEFDPEKQIAYTPLQYTDVMDYAIHKKRVKVVIFDESQQLVDAKNYWDFVNRSISTIQSTFRELKPLAVIYVAPSMRRVMLDIREQIDFYGVCSRPLDYGTRVWFRELVVGMYDVEKIRFFSKRIKVVLYDKKDPITGRSLMRTVYLNHLIMGKPKEENIRKYKELALEYKGKIVQANMERIIQKIRESMPETDRLQAIVEAYRQDPGMLEFVVERGKVSLKKLKKIHRIETTKEAKRLRDLILEEMKRIGYIADPEGITKEEMII